MTGFGQIPSKNRSFALPALAGFVLILSGCSHTTLIRPCITPAQLAELEKQEPPKVRDKLTGKADEDVRTLAGSSLRLRGWGYNLRDALRVCAK